MISPATVGCRCMCLWALTWSSGSPVARNASNCARISPRADGELAAGRKSGTRRAPYSGRTRRRRRTSPAISARGSAGAPSTSTKCRPTRRSGNRRARATASAAAGARDHQAGGRQNAVPVRLLDRLVDGGIEPEIVGADDQAPQLAISRLRRNWKNSTPSRSRRRIISGLLIISATSEAILPRRK